MGTYLVHTHYKALVTLAKEIQNQSKSLINPIDYQNLYIFVCPKIILSETIEKRRNQNNLPLLKEKEQTSSKSMQNITKRN